MSEQSAHDFRVTAYDGEGVGLACSCGWEWRTGEQAEDFFALSNRAGQHMADVIAKKKAGL